MSTDRIDDACPHCAERSQGVVARAAIESQPALYMTHEPYQVAQCVFTNCSFGVWRADDLDWRADRRATASIMYGHLLTDHDLELAP